ncbi:copper resistance D family protein [Labedaea rhizosphaerae]|uniref:Putative copper resistance protein D n=1 Tax=Labedaea rhizosphaerae TaxID=598644 RepID=A0A4R6SMA8_LABRH|nr:CopD family protein [Labedaea rhizosphaerae]TDQ05117.1 putative copper resistance protein D [Labedaea rhizosphaerae]
MTATRTTASPRYRLLGLLVAASVLGVLIGIAVVGFASVPGLADSGVVVRVGIPVVRALLDMSAVLTVGLAVLPVLIGFDRPAQAETALAGTRRLALAAALAWVVFALITLVLQTAELQPGADVSFAAISDYVGKVAAGKALVVVAIFALVCALLAGLAVRFGEAVPAELRAAVALFTLLPLPVTGHAGSWNLHDLSMISMELHVLAAVAWTGGLCAVVMTLVAHRTLLAIALPRFSKLATACVAAVAVTGVVNAVEELTITPDHPLLGALFGTSYGVLVLLKITCVIALAALGGTIRLRLLPKVARHQPGAIATWVAMELSVMGIAFGFAVVLTRAPVG